MKTLSKLTALLFLCAFASCDIFDRNEQMGCGDGMVGVFVDLTGLDGCGVVFERGTDQERFELTNLDDFEPVADGQTEYCVKYATPEETWASICMVGAFIDLVEVTEL